MVSSTIISKANISKIHRTIQGEKRKRNTTTTTEHISQSPDRARKYASREAFNAEASDTHNFDFSSTRLSQAPQIAIAAPELAGHTENPLLRPSQVNVTDLGLQKTNPAFHLFIPASESNPGLCETLLLSLPTKPSFSYRANEA